MVKTAILGMTLMAGCAGRPTNEFGVRLDPTLTAEQSERVLAALDEWGQKTGVVYRTNFSPDHCGGMDVGCVHVEFRSDAEVQVICTDHQGHHELGCAQGPPGQYANIYLTEMDSGRDAYQLVLHELGHAWGLAHDTGYSVMRVPQNYAAFEVAPRDVEQFDRIRGF
jgi:hypothetical protein